MTELFELVFASCGVLFLTAMGVGSLGITLLNLLAVLRTRDAKSLELLLPFAWLPAMIGCARSLLTISVIVSVYQSAEADAADQPEPLMLMAMGITPLLCGILFSLPSYLLISAARFWVLWPKAQPTFDQPSTDRSHQAVKTIEDPIVAIHQQTDNYLAQLVQSRSPKIIPDTEFRLKP